MLLCQVPSNDVTCPQYIYTNKHSWVYKDRQSLTPKTILQLHSSEPKANNRCWAQHPSRGPHLLKIRAQKLLHLPSFPPLRNTEARGKGDSQDTMENSKSSTLPSLKNQVPPCCPSFSLTAPFPPGRNSGKEETCSCLRQVFGQQRKQ